MGMDYPGILGQVFQPAQDTGDECRDICMVTGVCCLIILTTSDCLVKIFPCNQDDGNCPRDVTWSLLSFCSSCVVMGIGWDLKKKELLAH